MLYWGVLCSLLEATASQTLFPWKLSDVIDIFIIVLLCYCAIVLLCHCVTGVHRSPGVTPTPVRCALCPLIHGAMKRTTDGRWVHLSCVLFAPGVKFGDIKLKTSIDISRVSALACKVVIRFVTAHQHSLMTILLWLLMMMMSRKIKARFLASVDDAHGGITLSLKSCRLTRYTSIRRGCLSCILWTRLQMDKRLLSALTRSKRQGHWGPSKPPRLQPLRLFRTTPLLSPKRRGNLPT